jgi:hypothetical protein
MSDVAMSGILLQCGHSRAKWPERPQLKQVWPKVAPVVDGAGRRSTGGGGGRALGAAH